MGNAAPSASSPASPERVPEPAVIPTADGRRDLAVALLTRLFAGFSGTLSLRLWSGPSFRVGGGPADAPEPPDRFAERCARTPEHRVHRPISPVPRGP